MKDALLQQAPVIGRDRLKRTPPNDAKGAGASAYQMSHARQLVPINLESRNGSSPTLAEKE